MTPLCHLLQERPSALSAAADGESRSFLSVQSTPGWGCGMKTDGLHSP